MDAVSSGSNDSPPPINDVLVIDQLLDTLSPTSDNSDTAQNDSEDPQLYFPTFHIPWDALSDTSYSSEDYQIDAFLIRLQQKYNTNPKLVCLQLEHLFVVQLQVADIPHDIIRVIDSFLPKAPDNGNIRLIDTVHSIRCEQLYSYDVNAKINGLSILRTPQKTERKYFGCISEEDVIRITTSANQYELVYDFGVFSTITAILIKTSPKGLGHECIEIQCPQHKEDEEEEKSSKNEKDKWMTQCQLSVQNYDGWIGYTGLDLLSQIVKLKFDVGAEIRELLFV